MSDLYYCRDCNGPHSRQCYRLGHDVNLWSKLEIKIVDSPRPSKEPKFLVPESWAPRWEKGKFIECVRCRELPGTPNLCLWCLYVRERK